REVEDQRHGKFKGLVGQARDDLEARKYDEALAKLARAEEKARGDTELAAVRTLRVQAGSGPVAPLLDKAGQQFLASEFADCQQTARQGLGKLDAVHPLARKDVEQMLDAYLVLAWARDAGRDEKQSDEVLRLFTQLFDQGSSPRL